MSDWSDEMQNYEDNNWDDLAVEFINENSEAWYLFVSNKFFGLGLAERMGVNEDGGQER